MRAGCGNSIRNIKLHETRLCACLAYLSNCDKEEYNIKMDEKLQQIIKIRPLQANCIAYRSSTDDYRKMMKQTCVSELKNLLNVEMAIEQIELKMPDDEQIPPVGEFRKPKVNALLKECCTVEEGLKLL